MLSSLRWRKLLRLVFVVSMVEQRVVVWLWLWVASLAA